jgi:ATP-dependent Zn protease
MMMTLFLFQTAKIKRAEKRITFPKFIELVKKNEVEEVTLKAKNHIAGKFKNEVEGGGYFELTGDLSSEYYTKLLNEHNLVPNYDSDDGNQLWV